MAVVAGRAAALLAVFVLGYAVVQAGAQKCSASWIAFPEVQCKLACPKTGISCKNEPETQVQVRGVEYCCLCVDNGMGDYNSRMCATSAEPAPRLNSNPANVSSLDLKGVKPANKGAGNPVVSVNVDMDLAPNLPVHIVLNQTGDSWVSSSHLQIIVSLTAVQEPAVQEPAVQDDPGISPVSEGPSEKAAITATNYTNATQASNRSDDSDCDSTGGYSTADNNTLCNSSRREQTLFSASHFSKKALQLGKEPLGSLSCGGAELEMLQAQGVVIRRDAHGDEDLVHFWTPDNRDLSRRQMGNVNHPVKWYVQIGGLPDATASPPVYDYASEGASSVSLLNYNPNGRYFVSLVSELGYWKARVTFGRREMIYLQENKDTAFQVQADSRVFTTFQADTDGLVVLKMKISQSKNARVRVWVNINSPATERSWVKWVGGNDTEVNNVRNRFFASIHLIRSLGFATATWTFQCDQTLDWTVHPSLLAPISIRIDTPNTFTIDPMNGAVLFRLSNGGKDSGRLYFQIMPASDPDSMRAYPSWQDLERAIKMVSSTVYNGELRYYGVSDWGYTSDGTPGLQVIVSSWDDNADVWLQVFLQDDAPNPSFTVVCYQMGDAFDTWKWWFGGIVFAIFVFCIARCIVCRSRSGLFVFPMYRYAPAGGGGHHDGVNESLPQEIVTTTEPIPTHLKRVAETLYARPRPGLVTMSASVRGSDPVEVLFVRRSHQTREDDAAEGEGPATAFGPEDANNDEDYDRCCIVCLDRQRNALLLECGHGGLCVPCADALWKSGPSNRHCPMCRKIFTGVMRIISEEGDDVEVEVVHYAAAAATRPRRGIGNLLCLTNLRGTGGRRRNGQSSSQEATAAQEAAAAAAAAVTAVENDAASGVDGRRTSSGVSVNDGLPPAMRHVVPPNAWTSVDEEEARGD